jgi:hypothetical protein
MKFATERAATIFGHTDKKLLERFRAFHDENPKVYDEFKDFALQMAKTGRKKYSAWTIVNRIRWERDLESIGSVFKINNDFIALYARLLIYHLPEMEEFFELRTMKAFDRRTSDEERYRVNNQ